MSHVIQRHVLWRSRIGRALRKLGVPYSFSRKAGGYVVSNPADGLVQDFVAWAYRLHKDIMLNSGTTSVEMEIGRETMTAYREAEGSRA